MIDVLWILLAVALCAFVAWLGFLIEPHWVSRDGTRFLCNGQKMSIRGEPIGRWHETKVIVGTRGQLHIDQKRFMRRTSSSWTLEGEAPEPPRRKRVFLLRGHDETGVAIMFALRMPASSRAVISLEQLLPASARRTPALADSGSQDDTFGTSAADAAT